MASAITAHTRAVVAVLLSVTTCLPACNPGTATDPCNADYETPATFDPALAAQLQTLLDANLAASGAPGASLTVHIPGQGTFAAGAGMRDILAGEPVLPRTRFRVGSITKAFAAAALLRLVERGELTLDAHPSELLPDEPDPQARPGEWLPGVRLVNPRLLWALQRIADAFPWRTIYIYSGYRPGAKVNTGRAGSHQSMHSEARALDISVLNVPNEALFKLCHGLDDIGCGFYPHSRFIHVDVRLPGSGHPFWIDTSGPGEPANYVDAWPGVVDHGAMSWDGAHQSGAASVSGAEASDGGH